MAALCGPARAPAHPEFFPTQVNRYLSATVAGDTLELSLALLFGERPAAELRRELDLDRDGAITTDELAAARTDWRRRGPALVHVAVTDRGSRTVLDVAAALHPDRLDAQLDLGEQRAVAAAPLVVELRTHVSIPPAAADLTIELAHGAPPVESAPPGEAELTALAGPGWRLLEGEQAGARRTASSEADLTFKHMPGMSGNAPARFRVVRSVDFPAAAVASAPGRPSGLLIALATAALVAGVGLSWLTLRRHG